jgi:hypothetical protein
VVVTCKDSLDHANHRIWDIRSWDDDHFVRCLPSHCVYHSPCCSLPLTLYIVDTFKYAASALAAASVVRSLLGFVFPLFAYQMFEALGNGPGYSLLAGIAIVLGVPFPIWIYFYGERVRARSDVNR